LIFRNFQKHHHCIHKSMQTGLFTCVSSSGQALRGSLSAPLAVSSASAGNAVAATVES
jgi:hypothetical protein